MEWVTTPVAATPGTQQDDWAEVISEDEEEGNVSIATSAGHLTPIFKARGDRSDALTDFLHSAPASVSASAPASASVSVPVPLPCSFSLCLPVSVLAADASSASQDPENHRSECKIKQFCTWA